MKVNTHILLADISNGVDLLEFIGCESNGRMNRPVVSNVLCTYMAMFTSVNDFVIEN